MKGQGGEQCSGGSTKRNAQEAQQQATELEMCLGTALQVQVLGELNGSMNEPQQPKLQLQLIDANLVCDV